MNMKVKFTYVIWILIPFFGFDALVVQLTVVDEVGTTWSWAETEKELTVFQRME